METSPYWKKVWLTVTGRNKNVSTEDVDEVLKLVGDDLCLGISQYKPFTETSFNNWKSAVNVKDKDNILENFIHRLSLLLDLETPSAWKVFCNFLMFEYYGKIVDIKRIAQYEMYAKHLFQHVWLFYSSERMFVIKTLKHMLEKSLEKKHRFHELYSSYCKLPKLHDIQCNLLKQFTNLLKEIHGDNLSHCTGFDDWVDRNVREQIEVLSSIILSQQLSPLSIDNYKTLLVLIKEHNFGKDPMCFQILAAVNPGNLVNLKAIELGSILVGFIPCWDNPGFWNSHVEELESLFLSILQLEECPIILLAWATLQMTLPEKVAQEKFNNYYYKFTKLALQQNVFISLYKVTSNNLLQNCRVGKIIKEAVYVLLEQICDKFIDNGIILGLEQSDCLIADLITIPELAQRFILCAGERVASIFENTAQTFPVTFDSYTIIINVLMQYPQLFKLVSSSLMRLEYYTEEFSDMHFDDSVTLISDYRPNESINIVVPAKSVAKVFHRLDKVLVTYKTIYSYFDVLEDLVNVAIMKREPSETTKNSICLGFKLIKILLDNSAQHLFPLKKCMNLVKAIFSKFTKRPNLDFKLIEVCVGIYTALLEIHETHILEILAINNFLPDIIKDPMKVENYFDKNFFVPGVLFMTIQEEIATCNYGLLFALIKLLKLALHKKHHHLKIQMPSVALLFVHVFPVHLEWSYKDIQEKNYLTHECLEILLEILQQNYELLSSESDKSVYDFCYELITSYEPFLKAFMRLLQVPNVYLHSYMEKEFNWSNISNIGVLKIVKSCLSIVLLLFKKHDVSPKFIFNTSFSKVFFKSESKPSMLKIIAGHINHVFDKSIPKFACQLLKKCASYQELPMLSLLEMDYYQIQCMFLEKVRDPLEDENLKVLILEFITLCVEKQNGMTAAFFNIINTGESIKDGESIITFMEEYLQNVRESTDYLQNPIQVAVLHLFHNLWLFKKDILIKDLMQKGKFWSTLADPLFRNLVLSNRTYSQIFNILTFELFKCKGKNTKITDLLLKMFAKSENFVQRWTEHIIGALEENSLITHGMKLLASWKNILIAITKFCPECIEDRDTRYLLTQTCLDGLIQHFTYPDDIRVLTEWSELYLYLMTIWPTSYYEDSKKMFETLARIFKYLGEYYDNVGSVCKETLLSIAIKTIQDLHYQIHKNPLLVDDYLHSIGKIFEKEYIKIVTQENQAPDNVSEKTYAHWLLLLIFGNKLIKSGFTQSHPSWFRLIQFLDKIMTSIGPFIRNPVCFPIAKMSIHCLINYAQSPLVRDFLYVNLEAFFDLTRPPKRYINTRELSFKSATPWYFEEWWLTYSGIVQLMTILVRKFGHFKLDTFFSYIHIHDDVIKNSLMLPMVTAECTALQLVSACLNFCHALLKWRQMWKINYTHLYFTYLQSINVTINAVCRIFIRPRILKFFTIDSESKLTLVEKVPLNFIVEIMNQLMEVLGLCNVCLIKSSTDLLSLLECTKPSIVDDVGLEYDFHVPKIYEEHPEQLNYGTVLCILHFLCKTISHINLSKLSEKGVKDEKETNFIAFVCPDFVGGYTISEKYNSVQTFAASEISGMSAPWLTKLNVHKVNFAIETLNTFLASQIFLTTHVRYVKYNDLQYIKRELCSELLFFHEFIRKRMVEQCQYRVVENVVFRKSYSLCLPYCVPTKAVKGRILYIRKIIFTSSNEDDSSDDDISFNSSKTHNHLKELDTNVFYAPDYFEDICEDETTNDEFSTSLNTSEETSGRSLNRQFKKLYYGVRSWEDGCVSRVPIEQITLRYPHGPPIVNGDYLLLLSHWFIFICNLSH